MKFRLQNFFKLEETGKRKLKDRRGGGKERDLQFQKWKL